jgi:hypothetical protein
MSQPQLNAIQRVITGVAVAALLLIGLFPPWQQAAQKETAYRKDLHHSFALTPPHAIPVPCYFVGCKTAPASYFHVVLYRRLLVTQLLSVIGVGLACLWVFRTRSDGTRASILERKTRLASALLIALLVPPTGTYTIGFILLDIPQQLVQRDEFWLIPVILELFIYAVCALAAFVILSAAMKIVPHRPNR